MWEEMIDMDGPLDFESEDPLLSSSTPKKKRFSPNVRLLFGSPEKLS